jgi:hypothetical protein
MSKRREILASAVKLHDHIGISQVSNQAANEMIAFVKSHSLRIRISERVIARRSYYPWTSFNWGESIRAARVGNAEVGPVHRRSSMD